MIKKMSILEYAQTATKNEDLEYLIPDVVYSLIIAIENRLDELV